MTMWRLVNSADTRNNAAGRLSDLSRSGCVRGAPQLRLQDRLFIAEFRLPFLAKGRHAFARVLVHEKQRKAVDGITHLVTAETAVIERFCHLHREPWFGSNPVRERKRVRKHAL